MLAATRPAVVFSDGIGDTLMTLPTLRALSRLFGGKTVLIGSPRSLEILAAEALAVELVTRLDDPRETANYLGNCDLLITADPDHQAEYSGQLLRIAKPDCSIGWSPSHHVKLAGDDQLHFIDEVFKVAKFFDRAALVESFASPPKLGIGELEFARSLRGELHGHRCFVVHCETGGPKMWSITLFRRFLELLLSYLADVIVLVVGIRDCRLDEISGEKRVVPCEGLPLAKSMALVGCADGFIGVDSSMLHVADLFRVPSVGLFGPTDARRWGCRFTAHEHVCAPRGRLEALEVERVVAAVNALLRKPD
jgi:ADP-heptose:LPS heptosyltransferase